MEEQERQTKHRHRSRQNTKIGRYGKLSEEETPVAIVRSQIELMNKSQYLVKSTRSPSNSINAIAKQLYSWFSAIDSFTQTMKLKS
jgi:hypothetical protein